MDIRDTLQPEHTFKMIGGVEYCTKCYVPRGSSSSLCYSPNYQPRVCSYQINGMLNSLLIATPKVG